MSDTKDTRPSTEAEVAFNLIMGAIDSVGSSLKLMVTTLLVYTPAGLKAIRERTDIDIFTKSFSIFWMYLSTTSIALIYIIVEVFALVILFPALLFGFLRSRIGFMMTMITTIVIFGLLGSIGHIALFGPVMDSTVTLGIYIVAGVVLFAGVVPAIFSWAQKQKTKGE